jgi:regulator of sigma E protease
MLIISAGVVMNILLGMACFVAAYMHGVKEKPATVGTIESGGAAWQVGMRTDDHITEISGRPDPYFNDLRPYVMSTRKGEAVEVEVRHPDGSTQEYKVEPLREEGARFPQLGIAPPYRLTLLTFKKGGVRPTVPGSPADEAKDPGFEAGDRVIATTDPDPTKGVTPLPPDPLNPGGDPDVSEFYRRMAMLAGKPVTIRVQRKDRSETADVVVQPAYRADLGVRMRMGKIVALRKDGPAAKAGVQAWSEEQPTQGDRIKTVKLPEPGDKQTWFAAGDVRASGQSLWPGRFPLLLLPDGTLAIPVADGTLVTLPGGQRVTVRQLDPVELPLELKMWADRAGAAKKPNFTVGLEVLRPQGHQENTPVSLSLTYDPKYRYDQEGITLPNSPVPLGGLGLAYWVEAVVDEVDKGGPADGKLQREDIVTAVRFKTAVPGGETKAGDWNEVKPNQWASVDAALQSQPRGVVDLKVKRGDEEVVVEDLKPRPDTRHPTDDRGLVLQYDFRVQTAADVGDAVRLGYLRTARSIKEVYMGLYAMAFGRVSAKTMSGPLTIGNVAYRFAGEDFWQFLLFLGLISVNLAVVNFLPIPVLDGGHMVFLTLEWVLGRPVPERIFGAAMWIGVILILSLMVFVFVLDIRRLFFGWF